MILNDFASGKDIPFCLWTPLSTWERSTSRSLHTGTLCLQIHPEVIPWWLALFSSISVKILLLITCLHRHWLDWNLPLCDLKAFGTDSEQALSNALQMVFKEAKHLHCFLHFKSNLEDRLKSLHIPKSQCIEFLRDVFGNLAEFEDGLVDTENEECFDASLISLQEIWTTGKEKLTIHQSFTNGLSVNVKRWYGVQC